MQGQQRDVVAQSAFDMLKDGLLYVLQQAGEGQAGRLSAQLQQSVLAELLDRSACLRHAVGVEQERLAAVQLSCAFLISIGSSTPSSVPGWPIGVAAPLALMSSGGGCPARATVNRA